jgi:hypothetical protein
MRKQITETVSCTPDPDKTVLDYFGDSDGHYEYEKVCNNTIFQAFNSRCRELNTICNNHLLDIGEAQCMIGFFWTHIKYRDFDNVKDWLNNNYYRRIQILEPGKHKQIMEMKTGSGVKEYQEWFMKNIN